MIAALLTAAVAASLWKSRRGRAGMTGLWLILCSVFGRLSESEVEELLRHPKIAGVLFVLPLIVAESAAAAAQEEQPAQSSG